MTKNWRPNLPQKILTVLCLSTCITSCVSQLDEGVNIVGTSTQPTVLTDAELKQYLDEWQAAKPGIERLTELESDLAFLIAEVVKMSDLNNVPEKYALADQEVINGDNVVVATMTPSELHATPEKTAPQEEAMDINTTEAFQKSTEYAVHVASFLKPQSAQFGWFVVQREYPGLMNGLTPKLLTVSTRSQQLHSLRVGPFQSNSDAENFCMILKRKNYWCASTRFEGTVLNL